MHMENGVFISNFEGGFISFSFACMCHNFGLYYIQLLVWSWEHIAHSLYTGSLLVEKIDSLYCCLLCYSVSISYKRMFLFGRSPQIMLDSRVDIYYFTLLHTFLMHFVLINISIYSLVQFCANQFKYNAFSWYLTTNSSPILVCLGENRKETFSLILLF